MKKLIDKIGKIIKSNLLLTSAVFITILIGFLDYKKAEAIMKQFLSTCKSTIPILLLMFALLAFIQIGMSSGNVQKAIQKNEGIKSILLAYLFGFLVSGPIYPGFSLGKLLIEKGMKVRIVIIMLSTWATIKIALLPFEIKLLGGYMTIVRWLITIIVIFFMGVICEGIISSIEYKRGNQIRKQTVDIDEINKGEIL